MFSFLTSDYKKTIMRIYRLRLASLYLVGVIFVSLFSAAMLVPSYMISLSHKAEVTAELDALKKSLDLKKNTDTESFIDEASAKIKASASSVSKGYMTDAVEAIVSRKGSEISLSDITLEKIATGLKVSISGVALTRDGLLGFVKDLKSSDSLKSVDLPVSSLAKEKNISFTITLESFL